MLASGLAVAKRGPSPEAMVERRLREAKDRRGQAVRDGARLALERLQTSKAGAGAAAAEDAKPKRAKRSKARNSRKAAITDAQARTEINKLVTPEAQRHGDYQFVAHEFIEVTEGGQRTKKERNVVRNFGGTTVERWHRNCRLDERHMAAIGIYCGAFEMRHGRQRVTSNWDASFVRSAGGALERFRLAGMDAKELLRLFDQDIFFRHTDEDGDVFRNVVLFDEPAGVAGSRLGFKSKQAEAAALLIVRGISHEIAALVVDQNPPDLSQLLVDLDAPRKPRVIPIVNRNGDQP